MTSHLSERFHDQESKEVYLDLIQSSLDRPLGLRAGLVYRPHRLGGAPAGKDLANDAPHLAPLVHLAAPAGAIPHLGFLLSRSAS